jgi:predicted nucleic acid-binding protein
VIVLDASVLIAHFSAKDAHHEQAIRLLEESASEVLGVSPVTLAEVLVAPARAGMLAAANAALHDLGVRTVDLADDAPERLANLRADTNLKLPDCCVLLAAEQAFARIATFDDRLSRAAGERRIEVLGRPG